METAILASVKSDLTMLGIVPISEDALPSQWHQMIPVINFVCPLCWFLALTTYSITVICFLLFEAETFIEFAECGIYCSVSFFWIFSPKCSYIKWILIYWVYWKIRTKWCRKVTNFNRSKIVFRLISVQLPPFYPFIGTKNPSICQWRKWENSEIIKKTLEIWSHISWNLFTSKHRTIVISILYQRIRTGCVSIEFPIVVVWS